jgi:hypothetical protein
MAAGLGFKTFTTGEVLTAGDVNGYLMQGINVFTNATARDAAITAPAEGQFAFTKDNNSLWYYDGAAWVASGATGDIEGVTAGVGISGGGTSGTVTVTNSMATAIDAKGDLVPGTGADTFARLAVGANDTVLTADSSTATGLKWAAPAGGGGLNWTLLNTGGTTLSGNTTVSGISGKDNLLIRVNNGSNTTQAIFGVRVNADSTGGNYRPQGFQINGLSGYSANYLEMENDGNASSIPIGRSNDSAGLVSGAVRIDGCSQTGFKSFHATGAGNGTANQRGYALTGMYLGTSAITSVTIVSNNGSLNGGTVFVYGA